MLEKDKLHEMQVHALLKIWRYSICTLKMQAQNCCKTSTTNNSQILEIIP
jgi:hypothetical protein